MSIADTLLEEGRDTPAVIQLAILESPVMAEAGPLFERVCAELSAAIPTKDEAIDELLRYHLRSIASGTTQPREGLEAVMREVYWPGFADEPCKERLGDSRGMQHLIGAYWSYDDLTEGPRAIARWGDSVRQYARDWLQKYDRRA